MISKSGETIETISNLFALKILKKNSKNIIIISEKKNNFLYNLSKTLNLFYIDTTIQVEDITGGWFNQVSK